MVKLPNLCFQILNRVSKSKNSELKFESEESNKNKHKSNAVLLENKKKRH